MQKRKHTAGKNNRLKPWYSSFTGNNAYFTDYLFASLLTIVTFVCIIISGGKKSWKENQENKVFGIKGYCWA